MFDVRFSVLALALALPGVWKPMPAVAFAPRALDLAPVLRSLDALQPDARMSGGREEVS